MMITTREQLREFLAVKVMGWAGWTNNENVLWYRSGEDKGLLRHFEPDLSRDQFAEVWWKLSLQSQMVVAAEWIYRHCDDQLSRPAIVMMALSETPLTLCIAVARALGETVEIQ